MPAYQEASRGLLPSPASHLLSRLGTELSALGDALLNPGRIIAQVEEFRALHRKADRLDATDPARAAALRQRAARVIG